VRELNSHFTVAGRE